MFRCMTLLWAGLKGELEAGRLSLLLTCVALLRAGLTGELGATSGVSLMLTCMAFFVGRVDRRAGGWRTFTYVDVLGFVVGRVDRGAGGHQAAEDSTGGRPDPEAGGDAVSAGQAAG